MRFYIQAEDQALHQWLRCEWEPYEYQPQAAELSNPEATAEEKLKFALVFNGSYIGHRILVLGSPKQGYEDRLCRLQIELR